MAAVKGAKTPAEKIQAYIKLRDFKKQATDEFKKSLERVEQAMAKLEGDLLQHLNDTGGDSIAARGIGTAFRTIKTSASVYDRDEFMEFVKDNECWEALDVRANKTVVESLLKTIDAVPGVKVSSVASINVRRSS